MENNLTPEHFKEELDTLKKHILTTVEDNSEYVYISGFSFKYRDFYGAMKDIHFMGMLKSFGYKEKISINWEPIDKRTSEYRFDIKVLNGSKYHKWEEKNAKQNIV